MAILRLITALATAIFLLASEQILAQSTMDPSSALLLNSSRPSPNRNETTESRLDSGRYTVRPRSERATERANDRLSDRVSEKAPARKPVESALKPAELQPVRPSVVPPVVEPVEAGPDTPSEATDITEVKSHPAEIAVKPMRILDISVAATYLYEDAQSGYSFRQATMASPAYQAFARVWFTPEFAVGGSYLSTFGGQVADRARAVGAARIETAYGFYMRKPFADSSLTFGLELIDSQFRVSSDTVSKLKTKSTGARLSLEGEFQSDSKAAWLVGFSVSPRLLHEEMSAGTDVRSGTAVNAYAIGASIERRWRFDDSNAMFIRVEHRIERDLFTGSVSLQDPIGGATPDGVSATIGTTLIQFGYNWGG